MPCVSGASRRELQNLSLKLGGEGGKLHDLASVFACECCGRFLVLECENAWGTAVKVGFEGLVVFAYSRMMLETWVYIAIANHKPALRLHWVIAQIIGQLDHLYLLPRLLML